MTLDLTPPDPRALPDGRRALRERHLLETVDAAGRAPTERPYARPLLARRRRMVVAAVAAAAFFALAGGSAVGLGVFDRWGGGRDLTREGFDPVVTVSGVTLQTTVGRHGLCLGVNGAKSCGSIVGLEPLPLDEPIRNHMTFLASRNGGLTAIAGAVSADVARVEIELDGDRVLRPRLHDAPPEQQPTAIRFFLLVEEIPYRPGRVESGRPQGRPLGPPRMGIAEIRSYDSDGRVLDRFTYPNCSGRRAVLEPGRCAARTYHLGD